MQLVRFGHAHAGALLDADAGRALKHGRHKNGVVNIVAAVVFHHLVGEVRGRRRRAGIGQDIAGLNVVRAKLAVAVKPAVDVGHVVVVPQAANCCLVGVDGHAAAAHVKEVDAQLLAANDKVVAQRVAAKEGAAVVCHVGGLRVCPLVVLLGKRRNALEGRELVQGGAGSLRKGLPVGGVDHRDLGRLGHRKEIQLAVLLEVALVDVAGDILVKVVLGEVVGEVGQLVCLLKLIGGVCVRRENVGHGLGANDTRGRIGHGLLEVAHRALGVALDVDALLLANAGVELRDQAVKGRLLRTVVVVPHGERDRVVGVKLDAGLLGLGLVGGGLAGLRAAGKGQQGAQAGRGQCVKGFLHASLPFRLTHGIGTTPGSGAD